MPDDPTPSHIDLSGMDIPDDAIMSIPRHIAKDWRIFPVSYVEGVLTLAVADPSRIPEFHAQLSLFFPKMSFEFRIADQVLVDDYILRYYGPDSECIVQVTPMYYGHGEPTNTVARR